MTHPRLQAPRHYDTVRRPRREERPRHRRMPAASPCQRIHPLLEEDRPMREEVPRPPSRARQLRHAQDAQGEGVARRHPALHAHFTPTSASWLNQVERFFAQITERRIRRGTFRSVAELERAIEDYLNATTRSPARSSGPRPPTSSWPRSAEPSRLLEAVKTGTNRQT